VSTRSRPVFEARRRVASLGSGPRPSGESRSSTRPGGASSGKNRMRVPPAS
jgi:hypothetical protein